MIRNWRAVFAAAALAALLGCSARFEWREVRTPDGVSVSLPGKPQQVTRDVEIDGQRVALTMWSTGVGPTMFALGSARLPAALAGDTSGRSRTIAYFREGLVRNIAGIVTAATPVQLSLAPGGARKLLAAESVEAVGRPGPDGRKSRLAARFFIVDDHFFEVVALGAEGEIPPDVLDTFFTSFRLAP